MKQGLAIIVKCPYCGEKKELMSILSGNTIRAKYWSDMKQIAPMMPRVSPVQKCPKCGCYYLEYKQKAGEGKDCSFEKGDLSYEEWKEAYRQFCSKNEERNVYENGFLSFKKEQKIMAGSNLNDNDWVNMRLWLIQAYNDNYYRFGPMDWEPPINYTPPKEEYDFIVGIINDYIESFDWTSGKKPLLKAELYREAHQFEKCEETLQAIDYQELELFDKWIFDDIKERNDRGDIRVFRILDPDERWALAQKEEKERQKRAEQAWAEQESRDKRYKCCKNGHCYSYLGRSCPWCGDVDVVERLDEKTPVDSINLYVGISDGKWVLTTNSNVEGKSERIRKIVVDLVGNYKLYYHLDGKNPNPFWNNSIRVENQCFEGQRIVQLCDGLINGDKDILMI